MGRIRLSTMESGYPFAVETVFVGNLRRDHPAWYPVPVSSYYSFCDMGEVLMGREGNLGPRTEEAGRYRQRAEMGVSGVRIKPGQRPGDPFPEVLREIQGRNQRDPLTERAKK